MGDWGRGGRVERQRGQWRAATDLLGDNVTLTRSDLRSGLARAPGPPAIAETLAFRQVSPREKLCPPASILPG